MAYRDHPAREIMTTPAVACGENATFEHVAELLVRAGRLMGVVTRGDVLAAIAQLTKADPGVEEPPVVIGVGD